MTGTETKLGTVAGTGERATNWVRSRLEQTGLHTYRSFDLQSARLGADDCVCPHHGTDACDCQLVVLLVYQDQQNAPATVVLHGHQGQTSVKLAEVASPEMELVITRALSTTHAEAGESLAGKNRDDDARRLGNPHPGCH